MKFFFSFLLLFVVFNACAQVLQVLDSNTQEPISFAKLVFTKDGMPVTGDYCGQDGRFTMPSDKVFDTVEVSCIGYAPKVIAKVDITPIILLNKTAVELNEVVVTKTVQVTIGYSSMKKLKFSGIKKGFQDAVYIENTLGSAAAIQSFLFKIVSAKQRFAYRLHIYKAENDNRHPGNELLHDNVIGFVEKGTKGLVELDLSGYNIEFPAEGAFVGIEGLGLCDENGALLPDSENASLSYETFQCDKPIYWHQPDFYKNVTWINIHEMLIKDYTQVFKTATPKNELRAPSFGLKVVR
ncbi:carboxypeptidase-like regulatory domain-containing protein [Flavobacterium subsaxonicum]|uniref:Carboxypeptidase-like regulatory domain-containing protein n=1 Tax=Flavobacterium subsaxonicum WB 4.1-42 = DSM 21790 TaxID=1121898 RepID=A0A0A2MGF5_9FLAO|nr:hypothetical protein [Flavobacterium subsaxonicum]KGO90543.1 hypothetical protein Q766_21125 [Flavobacterium subsaxonicum WB 4.1-42 = DSM 21790]